MPMNTTIRSDTPATGRQLASHRRTLSIASLIDACGDGLFLVIGVLYYTSELRMPADRIGVGITLAGLAGLTAGPRVGRLADRYGPTRIYQGVLVIQSLACVLLLAADRFVIFLLVVTLVMASERANRAVRGALVARLAGPDGRVAMRAAMRTYTNIGVALGTLAGAAVAKSDSPAAYRYAILLDAASYLVALALLWKLPKLEPARSAADKSARSALRDIPFVMVTALNGIMVMNVAVLTVALPLWVVTHTGAPRALYPILILLNTVVVISTQRPLSRGADTVAGAGRAALRAGIALLIACVLMALSSGHGTVCAVALMLAAVLIHSLGEVQQAACGMGLSFELARQDAIAEYQGLYGLGLGAGNALGASVVSVLCVEVGAAGWLILGALFAATGTAVRFAARWAANCGPRKAQVEQA